ncbi:hypothetical protein LIER_40251 [Lithospermum erythrorhizon]|uniref:F-box associated beta-propeller type 1 domain-containing protein n=1 Tax=Lithospermum erythrorhizon TaxID=34254 RepID=A0AAV3QXF0_LITER
MASSDLPQIPNDIILKHILPKFPIKSLLRFKCLNQQYFSTISDPDFKISSQNKDRVLLTSPGKKISSEKLYYFVMNNEGHIQRYRKPPTRSRMMRETMIILGSCKGLILFSINEEIFLWNPSILRSCRKVIELDRLSSDHDYRVHSGFFYDNSEKDFKVVVRLLHSTPSYGGEWLISTSLKSKRWKHVSFPDNKDFASEGPVVNDRLHWVVCDRDPRKDTDEYDPYRHSFDWKLLSYNSIVYFDSSLDEFKLLPMPDPIEEGGDKIVSLGVIHECLCMIRKITFDSKCDVEILMMKEYGVKQSWTSSFIILDVIGGSMELVMVSKQYDALYSMINGKFYVYNPTTMTFKKILDPKRRYKFSTATPFIESALPTNGYYWNAKEHKKGASTMYPNRI